MILAFQALPCLYTLIPGRSDIPKLVYSTEVAALLTDWRVQNLITVWLGQKYPKT